MRSRYFNGRKRLLYHLATNKPYMIASRNLVHTIECFWKFNLKNGGYKNDNTAMSERTGRGVRHLGPEHISQIMQYSFTTHGTHINFTF